MAARDEISDRAPPRGATSSGVPTLCVTDPKDSKLTEKPPRLCACTGVRWCAACLDPEMRRVHGLRPPLPLPPLLASGDFTPDGRSVHAFDALRQGVPSLPDFEGVLLLRDFVSDEEARVLLGARAAPSSFPERPEAHSAPA